RLLAMPSLEVLLGSGCVLGPDSTRQALACLELVSTRAHRLRLGTAWWGRATLPLPAPTALTALVPRAADRWRLAELLNTAPLFAGALASLPQDLPRLLEAPPLAAEPSPPQGPGLASWGQLQARVEERFGINLGPGGLPDELARRGQART